MLGSLKRIKLTLDSWVFFVNLILISTAESEVIEFTSLAHTMLANIQGQNAPDSFQANLVDIRESRLNLHQIMGFECVQ